MPKNLKATAIRVASTSALAATAATMIFASPASASALTDGIAATARAEEGNGACAHGGYVGGSEQSSSCYNGQRTHAWCADFAGWVWARNGVTGLSTLSDMADSFYDYGVKYGTLSSTPHVGDAVVYNHGGSYSDDHVALVTAISGNWVTITGGNQGGYPGHVSTHSTDEWQVGSSPWGQRISGYISPAGTNKPSYPAPSSLADGTLVKSPNGPDVKVMIKGAGVPVAGSDVTPDKYDLSKIVLVDDSAFRSLASAPPAGTVVHDQAGGVDRYVVIDGAALKIGGEDWTAAGYNTRPDMGVPSAWLKAAAQRQIATGLVVMDQTGKDPARYVMVEGGALHISASEWTADGYNEQTLMGVPGEWLKAAAAKAPANGTVVMNQSGSDPARYVMVNGTAVHISAAEWSANGYDQRSLMGVPGEWLAGATAKQLVNGTVVKDAANPTVYVMAGGKAVALTYADFTGLGYDKRPLEVIPGEWLASAAAKAVPADGTMLLAQGDPTVWLVTGGKKRAMTEAEFGPGKADFANVVSVPTALIAALPTV
ncbi:CHAP domain-containing protein [Streptomyces sp. Ag109_G2-6]|uniref:CHAP domain-containing protein n=1 Tax=Streptomyces TaxID=1883 RepID=UPI0009A4866E|nr:MULTISPECIES: CHAP domain-containing protein [Streptomyces]RPF46328.1 CHAP domain-containing protein [Streptomyces sp. Ag109_G2-6]